MFLSLTIDPDGKAKYEKVIKKVLGLTSSALKVYPEKWLDCYKEYVKNPTGFMCTKLGNPCFDTSKDFATDMYLPYDKSMECTDGDTATKHI